MHRLPGRDGFITGDFPKSPCPRKARHSLGRPEESKPAPAMTATFLFTHN